MIKYVEIFWAPVRPNLGLKKNYELAADYIAEFWRSFKR